MCDKPKVDNSAQEAQAREAERARQEQLEREKRIRKGERDIRNIFEGGRYQVDTETETRALERPKIAFVAGDAVTQQQGRGDGAFTTGTPDQFSVGDKFFDTREAARDFRKALPREETIETPVFARSKGIQPILDQRENALRAYFAPQVEEQFEDASDDLVNALARNGLLRSSVNDEKTADLASAFARRSAEVESDIQGRVSEAERQFANERSALEATLRSTGNREASTAASLTAFERLAKAPNDLTALPALFTGAADGIGTFRNAQEIASLNNEIRKLEPRLRTGTGGTIVN